MSLVPAPVLNLDPGAQAMADVLAPFPEGLYEGDALRHAEAYAPAAGLRYEGLKALDTLGGAGVAAKQWNRWMLRLGWRGAVLDRVLREGRLAPLTQVCRAHTPWRFADAALNPGPTYPHLILRALRGEGDEVMHIHQGMVQGRFGTRAPAFFEVFLDPRFPRLWEALAPEVRFLGALEAAQGCVADLGARQPAMDAILGLGFRECRLALEALLSLLKGDRVGAAAALKPWPKSGIVPVMAAWLLLLEGREGEALAAFDAHLKAERKERGRRKCGLYGFGALLHALAVLRAAPRRREEAVAWLQGQGAVRDPLQGPSELLAAILAGTTPGGAFLLEMAPRVQEGGSPLEALILGSAMVWEGVARPADFDRHLREVRSKLPKGAWGAAELDSLLEGVPAPGLNLASWIRPVAPWEQALNELETLAQPQAAAPERPRRMAWIVSLDAHGAVADVEPRDQKRGPRGWTKGQRPSTGRSFSPVVDPWLLPQDYAALEPWRDWAEGFRDWGGPDPEALAEVLEALADHPHVFLEGETESRPLQIRTGGPALHVEAGPGGSALRLIPPLPSEGLVCMERQDGLIQITRFQESHRRAAALLASGLVIPAEGTPRLEALLPGLARTFPLRSDTSLPGASAEAVLGDPTLHLVLQPIGQGLRVTARLRPLPGGPWVRPGEGGEAFLAAVDGRLLRTRRDLPQELARIRELLEACPALAEGEDGPCEYRLPEPGQALELLEALDRLPGGIQAHWPEGAELKLAGRLDERTFRMEARGEGGWFEASGELRLDDGGTLTLVEILRLMEDHPGRFVALGPGRYLALTAAFRKRLSELAALGEAHGGAWRIPALAAPLVEEQVAGDDGFRLLAQRYREAFALRPALPKGFQAELRPYQEEGFQWLARMAAWEAGAVLADDMGLGKTVMTLALLLQRAQGRKGGGPALVVAPTSVMGNWEAEAARFAPTLNLHRYHEADRAELLRNLGRRDVVLTSYGLLQRDAEAFAAVEWNTLVLDEAQALKNAQAKRSQAAAALKARFRIALTGTPLENHLGELWSLFRILNPGLLGSQERFNRRFAGPIERDKDGEALHRLQRLVRPFLLRRTKAEVLEDLPERTEILREVELSREEAALYEALRRKAVEDMAAAGDAPPGQRAVKILAELMRLRRVCCHPSLALPEWKGPAAKLEAFRELAEELREGGHRALVFSQFVDHLRIVRAWMESEGIPFQYLDGSTPAKARSRAVEAFQGGEGDFFLISLTAGGTGLNLTAADYVVILDPWWNPAVEDQASSRAHRMGQQRPVTVYRLVAKGTLEAKIVQLHHRKRELAESILATGEAGGRLSPEALMELLTEGGG